MKRAMQLICGAAFVCLVAAVVVTQTGFGQQGPNPQCPALRTDPLGFPLFPPFSEYDAGGSGETSTGVITVLKENLPCCAIIADDGTFTLVPADGILERCVIPSVQVFPGETCPAEVDVTLTVDSAGVVRNCLAPFGGGPPLNGGGSNYFLLTGGNGN